MKGLFSKMRLPRHAKPLIEDALSLDVSSLKRAGLLAAYAEGWIEWTIDGYRAAVAEVYLGPERDVRMCLHLQGYFNCFEDAEVEHVLTLAASSLWHGGQRWWLLCPFCDGRFGKLFWTETRHHFLCRSCGGLTYYSSRTAHWQERVLASLGRLHEQLLPPRCDAPHRYKG